MVSLSKDELAALKFPIKVCVTPWCLLDLTDKMTDHIEHGFDEAHSPILTGFCPKCGRGYPMVKSVPEPVEAAPTPEPIIPEVMTVPVKPRQPRTKKRKQGG